MSSLCNSDALGIQVSAVSMVAFMANCLVVSDVFSGIAFMYLITCCTSHTAANLGCGGLLLLIAFSSCLVLGCFPTCIPSIRGWYSDMADLWPFIVLYSRP